MRVLVVWLALCLSSIATLPAASQPWAREPVREDGAEPELDAETLDWTQNPGAFEQGLRRRYENPLFSPSRRQIEPEELQSAVIRDADDARRALADFIQLALEQSKLARLDEPGEIEATLERFDASIREAAGIGGEAYKLSQELRRLRAQLLEIWREDNAGDARVVATTQRARERYLETAPLDDNPFIAQLLREDGPIPESEWAPALLSEDVRTIELSMRVLDTRDWNRVQRGAVASVEHARQEGAEIEDLDAKLDALATRGR